MLLREKEKTYRYMCANCRPKYSHKPTNKRTKNFISFGELNGFNKTKLARRYLKHSTYGSNRLNAENTKTLEYAEGEEPIKKIRKENNIMEFSSKINNDSTRLIYNETQIQSQSQSAQLTQDDVIKRKLESILTKTNATRRRLQAKLILNSNDGYSTIDNLLNQYGNNLISNYLVKILIIIDT